MRNFKKTLMILGIPALVGILVLVIYTAFVLSRIVPMDNEIPDNRPMVDNSGRDGSYADQKVPQKKAHKKPVLKATRSLK